MLNATPILRLVAARRRRILESLDPAATQERELLMLVRKAAQTRFGRDHGFADVRSVDDFQKRVRLRTYTEMWDEYWKESYPRFDNISWPTPIKFFAVSSGTSSGKTKYLPVSPEMIRSNAKAGTDLLVHHVLNRPESRLLSGRSFFLGGSTDLVEETPGIFSGDLSGISTKTLPLWAKLRYFPPANLALIKNWEEKIDTMARASLRENITMLSGVPAWLLIFMKKMQEIVPGASKRVASFYPNIEMLVHGGVNFAPYRKQFEEILAGSRAELREVYPASEGFIALADRGSGEGLRLMLDHGIFFEFVPLEELTAPNPTRHWVKNIELGVNYAIVLSTCAGMWSYVIGDTVRFVDRSPPRLLVSGRTAYYLSAFGEHLIAEEIDDGLTAAANAINGTVSDYSVGALFPAETGGLGRHIYIVEFAGECPDSEQLKTFITTLDRRLQERNDDYQAHRAEGFGLDGPQIVVVQPGTFREWMRSRGKLGGQHKVPRIITDTELLQNLREFARSATAATFP
ncbi:MAG: hypothetical protein RL417_1684 [Pseudomonadota bacterium]|jgi:hypothetical protein